MYAVVGCSNCQALWIVEGRPETTTCPRCGTRHQFERLKQFVKTPDREEAREVRSAMLAAAQDREEAYERLDPVSELGRAAAEDVVDDEEYLDAQGLAAEEIAAAGERSAGSTSRRERVLEALRTLDEPTESAVIEYATDHGVPAEAVRDALEKLVREGTIVREGSGYRLL
ncbi:MAG: DUF5817 domain-containing protein [Halodesulfurarchaeum sp.]